MAGIHFVTAFRNTFLEMIDTFKIALLITKQCTATKLAIKMILKVSFAVALIICVADVRSQETDEETGAQAYMQKLNSEILSRANEVTLASWASYTNVSEENNEEFMNLNSAASALDKEAWETAKIYNYSTYQNATLKRMFELYSSMGAPRLSEDKFEKLTNIIGYMMNNYESASVCDYHNKSNCDIFLEPDLLNIFATNSVPEELSHYWVEWHKVAGTEIKENFTEYIELSNESARLNNYSSVAEMWQARYDVTNFEEQLDNIWESVKPLYQQLHAYIRRRLREKYGDIVPAKGPIPVHLTGDIWGSIWTPLESLTRPFSNKAEIDISVAMLEQNYTVDKIFRMADEFFQSVNMTGVPKSFWNLSVFVAPFDREVSCYASAWDFFDAKDFRIFMCAEVNAEYFQLIHQQMGQIQYYMQYRQQPYIFRDGANAGFHKAVEDTIALSVTSPKHLKTVGLIKAGDYDEQTDINHLFKIALDKVVFLPFALMLETYRYGVFRGETTPDNYNCHYYRLKEQYQGMQPPVTRTEDDFDAGALYHVLADEEYAKYYIGSAIPFQFHLSLCQTAGQYDPNNSTKKLSDCDIYQSTAAGNAFADMLKLGSSKPWPDAMEAITGQRDMTGDGIIEYFKPLYDWLVAENNRTGEYIGWEESTIQYCTPVQLADIKAKENN